MNRIALYASALALSLTAVAANAQQPNLAQSTPVDGRQLIAALDTCQQYVEESRRVRCEMIARKTGGQATQLSGNQLVGGPLGDLSDQYNRSHN